jgi:hypothetical protein
MLQGPGKPKPTPFTQIYETHKAGDAHESGDRVRSEATEDGVWRLYTHTPLMPNGSGEEALARRLEIEKGAKLVKEAMITQYGPEVAEAALWNVGQKTARNLGKEVTRGDLNLLQQELEGPQLQELKELRELRDRVPSETPREIRDDLAKNWAGAVMWDYRDVQWPDGHTVLLNSRAYIYYVEGSNMQFDEKTRTLILTYDGNAADTEKNKEALTKFIFGNFQVEPGEPEFQNIANNILAYLPGPATDLKLGLKMRKIANDDARGDIVRLSYTFSVRQDGTVSGRGDTSISYRNTDDDNAGRSINYSKYKFVRWEGFDISGKNLRSKPDEFKAEANLGYVNRFDNIEFAD